MKKLIILLLFLLSMNIVFAEEFPPTGAGIEITKETNPIYWGYLEDYGKNLKAALEKKRMFRLRGWGASWEFDLTRDGQIKNMRVETPQNDYFNEKVKEIILSVPPEPFREGMNLDEMQMSVFLGFQRYDEISITIGGSFKNNRKTFSLIITTGK